MKEQDLFLVWGLVIACLCGAVVSIPILTRLDIKSKNPITHTTTEITIKNGVSDTTYILER